VISSFLLLTVFSWKDHGDGRLELLEDGKTALVYNYGPQLKDGVPEDRRRCCYIFPALTPAGVSPLDDFPKDHHHHRGLFWAWPVVETPDAKYDGWMMKGLNTRFEKFLARRADESRASLAVENGWYAGEKKLAREVVRLTVLPARGTLRTVSVELTLEALEGPLTLRGSPDKGKSYGGFSARFAPREQTALNSAEGAVEKDEDLNPHAWAELAAVYGGKKATVRITPDPANPGAPYQWCLRHYGFVGASVPGRTDKVTGLTLEPGKPVTLRFRVDLLDAR
jgi:hypothetical protein